MVCAEICPDKARNSIFGVVYKPPIMNPDNFLSRFKQGVLEKLTDEGNKDIIMMGKKKASMHATRLHGLSQLVKEPTRVTEHTKTAINLVFLNNVCRIVSHGIQ